MTADPNEEIDIAASYSRHDAAVVVPLLDALRARGVKVWFDKNIPGGALWEEIITRNMRKAKAVVFFVSKESLASDRCFDEVSAARTLKRPIVPILVDPGVRMPDDLPDRLVLTLQTRNTVDAWPGAEGQPVDQIMRALAGFGVRGEPRIGAAVEIAQPGPRPEPLPPAPPQVAPARRNRALLIGALAGVVLAVGVGVLALSGVFGGDGKPGRLEIASEKWCSASAPALLALADAQIGTARLQAMADEGDREAETLRCVSANKACSGAGDASDMSAAYAACEKAAGKGSQRALFNQGWMKQRGCGTALDPKGAADAVRRSAEGGCAIAQFYLGVLYEEGDLVERDQAASIKWLTEAANQNYPPAMNRLGAAYALGRGVPEDDARATDYYRRAADLGDARAMLNYARALELGSGTDKNTGAAITYYRRAAAQSDDAEIKQLALDSLKRLGVSP